jgi:hypothetical protein
VKLYRILLFLFIVSSSSLFAQDQGDIILEREVLRLNSQYLIKSFTEPSKESRYGVLYKFPEIELKPKEIVLFKVPDYYSHQFISSFSFGHRQDEPSSKFDQNPAYTKTQILSQLHTEPYQWRLWGGSYSGERGAKFAEQGRYPEMDSLYEWPRVGHYVLNRSQKSRSLVKPKLIKLQNVGSDSLKLSSVMLNTIPAMNISNENIDTIVFSRGSDFGNIQTMGGRVYGGGQRFYGKFPGAFRLSKANGRTWSGLPYNWKMNKNIVEIPLYNSRHYGKTLTQVEVMCGDTKPDGIRNRDGGWGSLGNAKLTMKILRSTTSERIEFAKNKNVPPEGVVSSSTSRNYNGRPGDKLILENRINSSALYIMAVRLTYE